MSSIRPIPAILAYPAAWAVVFGLGLGLGSLARVERPIAPTDSDQRVVRWVIARRADHPVLTKAARLVTRLGNSEVTIPVVVALLGILVWKRRFRDARTVLTLALGGQLLVTALKGWFRRDRPALLDRLAVVQGYSFPSGHGLFAGVLAILSVIVIDQLFPPKRLWTRRIGIAVTSILALLVASSRVWLGVHYLTDVLSGFALGLAWASLVAAIRFGRRKRDEQGLARDA